MASPINSSPSSQIKERSIPAATEWGSRQETDPKIAKKVAEVFASHSYQPSQFANWKKEALCHLEEAIQAQNPEAPWGPDAAKKAAEAIRGEVEQNSLHDLRRLVDSKLEEIWVVTIPRPETSLYTAISRYIEEFLSKIKEVCQSETASAWNHKGARKWLGEQNSEKKGEMNRPIFEHTMQFIQKENIPLASAEVIEPLTKPLNASSTKYETYMRAKGKSMEKVIGELYSQGLNPLVLVAANRFDVGGIPEKGDAQEEILCRQTTLYPALEKLAGGKKYPEGISKILHEGGAIYVKEAYFLRSGPKNGYTFIPPFPVSFAISVPYDCNVKHKERYDRPESDSEYVQGMTAKMTTQLRLARQKGHDALVLTAFGCGAFQNSADFVGTLYQKLLNDPEFEGAFKKVIFIFVSIEDPDR